MPNPNNLSSEKKEQQVMPGETKVEQVTPSDEKAKQAMPGDEDKPKFDPTYGIYDVDFEIRNSKTSGEYSLKLTKDNVSKYVISKYAPREKINEKLDLYNKHSSTVFVVFGFAFGYVVDEIYKRVGPNANIFVIEPSPKLLKAQANLIEDRTRYSQVRFYNEICFNRFYANFFEGLHMGNVDYIEVIDIFNYKFFYDKYFDRIQGIIDVSISDLQTNIGTVGAIGDRYLGNLLHNSKYLNQSFDIKPLKNKYKGLPAVVVMAGPSLDKNLEELKNFDGLILAIGRTIQSVKGIGKNPDFSFIVDYSVKMDATFGGFYDIPLVALISCAQEVIQKWQDKLYFITHDETLEELLGIKLESFEINVSVSTLAIEFARYLGADPIIIIGQDLGFTRKKLYSKTCNIYEGPKITENLEKLDVSKSDFHEIVPGYYDDEEIISTCVFTNIKRWIQRFIKSNPHIKVINSTEGGARIEGAIQMPLKEAIEKYNVSTSNIDYTPELLFPEPFDIDAKLAETLDKLNLKHDLTKEIIEKSKELMLIYEDYDPFTSPDKVKEIYPQIHELEVESSKIPVDLIYRYIFEKLSYSISRDPRYKYQAKRDDVENALQITMGSILLYKSLELAINDSIVRIKSLLDDDCENPDSDQTESS
ncbi:MAG: hypothetical protein ATN31_03245 [Candidatus Epulonipiscioides saccharophilum]|nr:MAG: hypothetical protein ATN31_03245 [Epulopiscium sp. AS2M-Bin001]